MINHRLLSSLAFFIILSSCSVTQVATTSFGEGFDFSGVKSYSTYGRNSDFGDLQNINGAIRNNIELTIEQGFDERGLRYQHAESADIVIAYHLLNNKVGEFKSYNQQVKYCGYCLNADKNSRKEIENKFNSGSLVIDIINPKSQRTVWRSVYPLGFKAQDNSQEIQDKISRAIKTMLLDYPSGKDISQILNIKGVIV